MPINIICTIPLPREEDSKLGIKERGKSEQDLKDMHSIEEDGQPQASEITEFASESTLHGINHIFTPGEFSLRRALWACAFLASLGMFLYQSADRIVFYLEHHHVTQLDEQESHVMLFPAITLCNFNSFRRSKVTPVDKHYAGPILGIPDNDPDLATVDVRLLRAWSRYSTYEFYDRAGHTMEEMLLRCRYRDKECGPTNFTTVFTRYGKCYMFNSGKDGRPLLTTLKGGTGNGLEIMLDIQQDEYLPVWGETDETSFEAGVRVQIHSQSEPPFIHELGFGVAPGFQTFVSTQEQRLIYLPSPWGDCKADPINSDFFDTYSITACRIDCETRYVVENCNCRMVHMPGDAPYCTPEQYKECADPALDFLVEKDDNFCVCDTPCNTTRYGKELSMVKIPSKASAKYLAKKYNKTEDYIRENVLVLDIFFEALNYETIEQKKAYEVAGLLGDIGGQMGLFIGASILTILEIFDYLYEVLKDKVCKCRKKHNKKRSENMTPCETLRSHHSQDVHFNSSILPHHTVRGTFEDFAC
ncbi:acid-sensing ion channel 2-like isoform X1 [Lampetra fluviatilis]